MKLEKRTPSGREKDEASVKLLAKLREQLYSSNVSTVRQSAFNLSWMQEDGLEILEEALFSNSSRRTKGAATYGLRKMRGRMRGKAEQILVEGLSHPDKATAEERQGRRQAQFSAQRQTGEIRDQGSPSGQVQKARQETGRPFVSQTIRPASGSTVLLTSNIVTFLTKIRRKSM